MNRWNVKDLVGGLAAMAIGAVFLAGALRYGLGSARSMGPGYWPMLLGTTAILLGIVLAGSALLRPRIEGGDTAAWRPALAVVAGIASFALLIELAGLVPAVVVAAALCAMGDTTSRLLGTILLGAVTAAGAWLIFRVGLGLPMPAFLGLP